MNEINCLINCFSFLKIMNSCPSKDIVFSPQYEHLFELIMVILSVSPYVISFILLLYAGLYRTSRGAFVVIMLFIEVILLI
jgi:hypothetical protein